MYRPETQVYVQRMEEEKVQKEKGSSADNRSFFAKYEVPEVVRTKPSGVNHIYHQMYHEHVA